MFERHEKFKNNIDISQRNVEFGRNIISQYGFGISGEDLGGKGHRNVILDVWNGDVWVRRAK